MGRAGCGGGGTGRAEKKAMDAVRHGVLVKAGDLVEAFRLLAHLLEQEVHPRLGAEHVADEIEHRVGQDVQVAQGRVAAHAHVFDVVGLLQESVRLLALPPRQADVGDPGHPPGLAQ